MGHVEVLRQHEAEQQRDAERHVGVAGEVEIDLEGEAEGRLPGLGHRHDRSGRGGLEDRIDVGAERVADQHLLREADGEQHQAPPDPLGGIGPHVGTLVELVHDLAPAHERAGENLREEGDVERVLGQPEGGRAAGP